MTENVFFQMNLECGSDFTFVVVKWNVGELPGELLFCDYLELKIRNLILG